ncbi:MAG: hypothetical protein IT431_11760 [Phycisphaerales bacterium]|nr:hypothetical protein [Phycisphaerales bacterium]
MAWDDFVLPGFALLMLVVGVWPQRASAKRAGRDSFLISSRDVGGLANGFSIAASKIGSGVLVTYSTLVFTYGLDALWLFGSYVAGYILFYLFAMRLHPESRSQSYYTLADYFSRRFGPAAGRVVGALTVLSQGGWVITNVVAGGHLLGELSGLGPGLMMVGMTALIGAYLVVGGFNAVIRTDVVQYAALLVILCLVAWVALQPAQGATLPASPVEPMPLGQKVSFLVFGLLFPMGSAELWQRTYAARSQRHLLGSLAIASVSFVVVGLALSHICLEIRSTIGSAMESETGMGLALGAADRLSGAWVSLWYAAFLCAIVSSADTFVFTTASAIVEDLLEPQGLIRDERAKVMAVRVAVVGVSVAGVSLALSFGNVLDVTYLFAGITLTMAIGGLYAWLLIRVDPIARGARMRLAAAMTLGAVATIAHGVVTGVTVGTAVIGAATAVVVLILGKVVLA